MSGFFITFEGGEGAGKTTQIARLAETLAAYGREVTVTREPGGSPGADAIRHIVLSGAAEAFGPEMEAILFSAARMDHVTEVIRPAIEAGRIVICDRFHDSTRVYQGLAGVDPTMLDILERAAIQTTAPDLTIILDIDAATGLKRAAARRGAAASDRFEREGIDIHEARRRAFLAIAAAEPQRCVVVDAAKPAGDIAKEIAFLVAERLEVWSIARRGRGAAGGPSQPATPSAKDGEA